MTVWIQNPFDNLPSEGYRKQRFWLMSEAFVAAGHRVVFWTSDFSHAKKRRRDQESGIGGHGFEVRLIKTLPYRKNVSWARVRSHRAYARAWKRQASGCAAPDLIISSIPSISGAEAALELGRRFGSRVVVDVMDAWPETFERLAPHGFQWLARLVLSPLRVRARRIYRAADRVTGVCERYRSLTGRTDYHLAYHGIETGGRRPDADVRERRDEVRLVYAGTLGKTYDLETVIRAVRANRDFRLHVAGRWEGPAPERVILHGYLGQDDLDRLLESCDVGVIPMDPDSWVGLPYKICDYAKAGLRIVSSLGGESAALLDRYGCGAAYRPHDADSLAAAVRLAMTLPRGASRKMCEETLDAAKIYSDYVKEVAK